MKLVLSELVATATIVMRKQDNFWFVPMQSELQHLLKYSLFLGFFAFAGYLVNYTIRGTIWNVWPFIQTTLDVGSGLVFAGLQWMFFGIFPILSSFVVAMATTRSKQPLEFEKGVVISTYSMTPLCLSTLFIGVPYFDRLFTTLGFATFLFLIYYGFRFLLKFTIGRSVWTMFLFFLVFALIRQMFVFAIGY